MEKQETKNKEKKRFFFQFHLFSQLHLFRKRRRSVPEEATLKAADALGYPVTVRPSFVLGRRRGRWRSPPRTRTRRGNVGNAVEVAARTGPSWRTRVRSLFFFSSARRSCSPRPPPRSDRTKRANERKRKRASGEGKFKSLITFSSRKGASLSSSHSLSLSPASLPFPSLVLLLLTAQRPDQQLQRRPRRRTDPPGCPARERRRTQTTSRPCPQSASAQSAPP